MERTKLSSKGQVIIPKIVRDAHGWRPGTELVVEDTGEGVLLRPAAPPKRYSVDEVFGVLKYDGLPKTIEEMDAAVLAEARRRNNRWRPR